MNSPLYLQPSNPYRLGKVVVFPDGTEALFREPLQLSPESGDSAYTVKEGDRLDTIAYNKWNNIVPDASKWYWVLMDVNNIFNPLDLTEYVGKDIVVPDILRILALA